MDEITPLLTAGREARKRPLGLALAVGLPSGTDLLTHHDLDNFLEPLAIALGSSSLCFASATKQLGPSRRSASTPLRPPVPSRAAVSGPAPAATAFPRLAGARSGATWPLRPSPCRGVRSSLTWPCALAPNMTGSAPGSRRSTRSSRSSAAKRAPASSTSRTAASSRSRCTARSSRGSATRSTWTSAGGCSSSFPEVRHSPTRSSAAPHRHPHRSLVASRDRRSQPVRVVRVQADPDARAPTRAPAGSERLHVTTDTANRPRLHNAGCRAINEGFSVTKVIENGGRNGA